MGLEVVIFFRALSLYTVSRKCDQQARPSLNFVFSTTDLPWRNFSKSRYKIWDRAAEGNTLIFVNAGHSASRGPSATAERLVSVIDVAGRQDVDADAAESLHHALRSFT